MNGTLTKKKSKVMYMKSGKLEKDFDTLARNLNLKEKNVGSFYNLETIKKSI